MTRLLSDSLESYTSSGIASLLHEGVIGVGHNAFCDVIKEAARRLEGRDLREASALGPVPLLIYCPMPNCGARHIDEGEWATKPHHTHSCQKCGHTWRPAVVPTVGVQFLPGFKNDPETAK